MKKGFKFLTLSLALSSCFITTQAFAVQIDASSNKTKSIKGYYPSLDSVGSKVIVGENGNIDVGDIIAIPTDEEQTSFFNLLDKDGDPQLSTGSYSIVWWSVKPKEGYKWADEPQDEEQEHIDVTDWAHLDAVRIDDSNYINIPEVSTSKALQIPASVVGSRIAFSILPETLYGDPVQGAALFAPDLNYFWKNTNINQKPGAATQPERAVDSSIGNGVKVERLTPNNLGGGNTIQGNKTYAAIIYEDVDGNGTYTPGVDIPLLEEPKVNTPYVVDIRIYEESGNFRALTTEEQASIVWDFYLEDTKINGAEEGVGSFAFKTQTTNSDASEVLRNLGPNYSQQGLSLMVSFSFDDGVNGGE